MPSISGRPPPRNDSNIRLFLDNPAREILRPARVFVLLEENIQLALRAFGTIAAMHEVASDGRRVVGAYRARRCVQRVGRAHNLTASRDRVFTFDSQRDERPARDEIDQTLEKWL